MLSNKIDGKFEIENILSYKPFLIQYKENENREIEIEINGEGCLLFEKINEFVETEIKTNIDNQMRDYIMITGHNLNDIDYNYTITSKNKNNPIYTTPEVNLNSLIKFKKPNNLLPIQIETRVLLLAQIIMIEIVLMK